MRCQLVDLHSGIRLCSLLVDNDLLLLFFILEVVKLSCFKNVLALLFFFFFGIWDKIGSVILFSFRRTASYASAGYEIIFPHEIKMLLSSMF